MLLDRVGRCPVAGQPARVGDDAPAVGPEAGVDQLLASFSYRGHGCGFPCVTYRGRCVVGCSKDLRAIHDMPGLEYLPSLAQVDQFRQDENLTASSLRFAQYSEDLGLAQLAQQPHDHGLAGHALELEQVAGCEDGLSEKVIKERNCVL